MAANPSFQGKSGNTQAPVTPGQKNALPGTKSPTPEAILWIYTYDDRFRPDLLPFSKDLTTLWKGFCDRAVLVNGQGNKYRAKSGLARRLSHITNQIKNWIDNNKQPVPIDHLVIVGHGSGIREEYDPLLHPYYNDKGFFLLDKQAPEADQNEIIAEDTDPAIFGASYNNDGNFSNKRYIDLLNAIKKRNIKHIHLHTCHTGMGWYFLRRFAKDTQAIIYAYEYWVKTVHDYKQGIITKDTFGNTLTGELDGVFERPGPFSLSHGTSRQFQRVTLRVGSQSPQTNNNGTMILPGWEVRAYPHDGDAIIEKFSPSGVGSVTEYIFDSKIDKKWRIVKTHLCS